MFDLSIPFRSCRTAVVSSADRQGQENHTYRDLIDERERLAADLARMGAAGQKGVVSKRKVLTSTVTEALRIEAAQRSENDRQA